MKNQELTETINNKITDLQTEIKKLNRGGCLGLLRNKLNGIDIEIKNLISIIDKENQEV